ncbi:MAG: hypothetical protein ACYDGN_13720 [Acidimicrobiales bacterium]
MPQRLSRQQARASGTSLAFMRIGIGLLGWTAPKLAVREWIETGALTDARALATTMFAFRKLPKLTRFGVLALTAVAVGPGAVVTPCIDEGA